ncbi:hypothetical protein V2J09_019860 [Rumex salicifolius]
MHKSIDIEIEIDQRRLQASRCDIEVQTPSLLPPTRVASTLVQPHIQLHQSFPSTHPTHDYGSNTPGRARRAPHKQLARSQRYQCVPGDDSPNRHFIEQSPCNTQLSTFGIERDQCRLHKRITPKPKCVDVAMKDPTQSEAGNTGAGLD